MPSLGPPGERAMSNFGKYLADRPQVVHLIIAVFPVVLVASVIIALPLLLIPAYVSLLGETSRQYPTAFAVAVVIGIITSTCAFVWASRKTWLETADLFPANPQEPEA